MIKTIYMIKNQKRVRSAVGGGWGERWKGEKMSMILPFGLQLKWKGNVFLCFKDFLWRVEDVE